MSRCIGGDRRTIDTVMVIGIFAGDKHDFTTAHITFIYDMN